MKSWPMTLYLALAVLASLLLALGLVMMKSRAGALPRAQGRKIFASVLTWIRDPGWSGGLALQAAGYACYVLALAGAPVSIVAVMMQSGIALFTLFSVVFLHERAPAREWAGIATIVGATVLLSFSLSAGVPDSATGSRALAELSVVFAALAAAPFMTRRLAQNGAAPAIAAGVAFGLAALYTKAITEAFLADTRPSLALCALASPWTYAMAAANVAGIVILQNSFQQARGLMVVPLSSALSNVVQILGGMAAFGEHLPPQPRAAMMRAAAFALTVVASMMLAVAPEPLGGPDAARDATADAAPETVSEAASDSS